MKQISLQCEMCKIHILRIVDLYTYQTPRISGLIHGGRTNEQYERILIKCKYSDMLLSYFISLTSLQGIMTSQSVCCSLLTLSKSLILCFWFMRWSWGHCQVMLQTQKTQHTCINMKKSESCVIWYHTHSPHTG
jgi:hypothetical protein